VEFIGESIIGLKWYVQVLESRGSVTGTLLSWLKGMEDVCAYCISMSCGPCCGAILRSKACRTLLTLSWASLILRKE
jgi:hypothetical protein